MKKFTAITDGGKYGVQPTMERPKKEDYLLDAPSVKGFKKVSGRYAEVMSEYDNHLLTLPRYLRTQGLELLPDGEEFDAREIYQWKGYKQSRWFDCTKEEYEHGGKDFYYRQIVLAPLVKDQDVASVQNREVTAQTLFDLLAEHGGTIESTGSLDLMNIQQAKASGRFWVDDNSMGFVWMPKIHGFPETVEEVEQFEKWFPLQIELPESLKTLDWMKNKKP